MNFKLSIFNILFLTILCLGIILRFWNLGSVPLGFSEDEASIGYNAYSILKTGRDETTKFLPLNFESFGDYKSSLPVYITVPFISFFGLNEFATRLPAVLFGILSLIIFYWVGLKVLGSQTKSLMGLLFITISPWHVQISRFNTGLSIGLFLILGQILLIGSKIKYKNWLMLSATILLIFTDPSSLFISISILLWEFFSSREYKKNKYTFSVYILSILICLFLARQSYQAFYVKNSFYQEIGFQNKINQLRGYNLDLHLNLLGVLLQNKYLIFTDQVTRNYLSAFDFYYLFSKSPYLEKYFVSDFGKFYSLELIFFFLGLYAYIKNPTKNSKILFLILFLSPLPGIFSLKPDLGQSLFYLIIPFYLFVSKGVAVSLNYFKKLRIFFIIGFAAILILQSTTFFHFYFTHYPIQSEQKWDLGYKQINNVAQTLYPNYQKIIISDSISSKPYIFTLFFQAIDPKKYQHSNKSRGGSVFISTTSFDKYEFRSIDWEKDSVLKNTSIIGFNDEIPDSSKICSLEPNCHNDMQIYNLPNEKDLIKIVGL